MFTSEKLLKIKEKKTNIMKFNFSRKQNFPPEMSIIGFKDQIAVISETKCKCIASPVRKLDRFREDTL